MKTKRILIIIGGILSVLLGIFHCMFWYGLNWSVELLQLSVINSNVMQMLNLGIICLLICLGIILIAYRSEIASTRIGRALLLTLALFYLVRTIGEYIFPEGSITVGTIFVVCLLINLVPALMPNPK